MRDNIKGGALTETTFLVLLALYKVQHGYGINKWVEEKTDERVSLGAGTLYKVLNTLLAKKWIEPHGEDETRRKSYIITNTGKKAVENEKQRLAQVTQLANEATESTENE